MMYIFLALVCWFILSFLFGIYLGPILKKNSEYYEPYYDDSDEDNNNG